MSSTSTKEPSAKRKSGDDAPTPQKKKGGASLSPQTISYLKDWIMSPEHMNHPYPNDDEIAKIMQDTGINEKQCKCWFSNNRKRYWKVQMEKLGKHDIVESVMSGSLPPQTVAYLKAWILSPEHFENPFPTEGEKAEIIAATGIEKKQLSCWFSNNRKRFWKPRMDAFRAQHGLGENDPIPAELLQLVDTPSAPESFYRASAAAVEPASNFQQLDDFAILAAAGEALVSDNNKRQKTDEFVAV